MLFERILDEERRAHALAEHIQVAMGGKAMWIFSHF